MKKIYYLFLMILLCSLFTSTKANAQGSYALSVGDQPANKMQITSVPNITMTYGGDNAYSGDVWVAAVSESHLSAYSAYTAGNTQNPKDDSGKAYTSTSGNVPTHGTYYMFQPLYDGTLCIAVACNTGKPFFITEDGVVLSKYNGITYTDKYFGIDTISVKGNKTYHVFCTASKLGIYGFSYETLGNEDPITALQANLTNKIANMRSMESDNKYKDITSLVTLLDESALKYEEYISSEDSMTLVSAIDSVNAVVSTVANTYSHIAILRSLVNEYADLYNNTSYTGKADFIKVYESCLFLDYTAVTLTDADILTAISNLKVARMAYIYSQEKNSDGYIDVTAYVQSPCFHSATSETSYTSTGWVTSNVVSSSDCSARLQGGRACYNSWSNSFTSMNLYQKISGLPNGYYSIKCEATTDVNAVYDQHAYITTTLGSAESPALTDCDLGSNVWKEQVTSQLYCDNGAMTIGYASTSGGDVKGWFCVSNFQLRYYGDVDDAGIATLYNTEIADANDFALKMHIKGDAKTYQSIISSISDKADKVSQLSALETLASAKTAALASEAKYTSVMAEGQFLNVISSASESTYGVALNIVTKAYNFIISYINSDLSTYSKLDSYISMANAYVNNYAKMYNKAYALQVSFPSSKVKDELKDVMNSQYSYLISSSDLKSVSEITDMVASLFEVMQVCNAKYIIETNSTASDFTSFIQNPDAGGSVEDYAGWNINKGTGSSYTNYGQHYTGNESLHYFDSWNAITGKLNYYGAQTVNNIPNGTYRLTFICRTSGDKGAFVFAGTEKDTTWFRIPVQTHTIVAGKNDGGDSIFTVYNTYGQIWEDAEKAEAANTATELQSVEAAVNNGIGYGWQWQNIDNIVVDNHSLVIGMTTNSTYTGEAFNGTWFTVGDFSLTRTAIGDNVGWNPVSAIATVSVDEQSPVEMFTINGVRVNSSTQKGLYIIKQGSKIKKILAK
jgi:hypothetical protein